MSAILRALAQGHTANAVLKMISKSNPALASKVSTALSIGYTAEKILSLLSKETSENQTGVELSNSERIARNSARAGDVAKKAVMTATAIGAGGLLAAGMQGVQGQLPPPVPNIGPRPMSNAPVRPTPTRNAPLSAPQQTLQPPPLPQTQPSAVPSQSLPPQPPLQGKMPAQGQQPEGTLTTLTQTQQPPSIDSVSIIREMGLDQKINNLLAQGKSPEQVSQEVVGSFNPKQRKLFTEKVQKGQIPPTFDAIIRDYASKSPKMEQPAQKPVKGDLVALPNGEIGELEHIKEKQALVKDDAGKLHKVKSTDLESLTNKYKDVHIDVSTVPESERSAPLYSIRTANDDRNLIVEFFPRNEVVADDEYEYIRKDGKPFDPALLQRLQEGVDIPVTSGFEWAGFWNADKGDSRGSTNHHEIKIQAQDKEAVEKGEEAENPSMPLWFVRKKSLFRHGYDREARRQFGKHASGFRKEYKEMTSEPKKPRKKA